MRACAAASVARRRWSPKPRAAQVGFERVEPRGQLVGVVAVELDQEDGAGVAAEEVAQPDGLGVEPGAVEHVAVHHLDRRRPVGQDGRGGRQGVEQVGELDDEHGLRPRQLDQAELGLDDDAERPLRADEQVGQVERRVAPAAGPEGVEVVPADAAEDLREAAFDLLGVLRGQPRGPRGSTPLPGPSAAHLASSPGSSSGPQLDDAAVGQDDLQLEDVVDRLAVERPSGCPRSCWRPCRRSWPGWPSRCRGRTAARAACSARFRSSSTQPGSTRAQRPSALISRTRLRYLEQSRIDPGPDRLARLRRAAAPGRQRHAGTGHRPRPWPRRRPPSWAGRRPAGTIW